jgi:hypothetical protein
MNQEEIDAYWAEVKLVVPPKIEYRLHYDGAGNIVLCTMTDHPKNTNYIVVDQLTYNNYFHYYVKDNKLIKIDTFPKYSVQLKQSTIGYPTVAGHANLIIEEEQYTDIEYYDRKTDN